MKEFDANTNVLAWASEELAIPYFNPVRRKTCRYFPDFVVKKRGKDGVIRVLVVEVKPSKQMVPPKPKYTEKTKRPTKTYLREHMRYAVNNAKWTAAKAYCEKHGMTLVFLTEKDLC